MGSPEFKILIADDNRDAADSLGMILEMEGYHVVVAYTGRDALAMAESHLPDVVLLDIGMPDLSGHEVAREIRRAPWGNAMHLVAITGWGQTEDQDRSSAAGCDRHLTKPVDPDQLARLLQELLHHRTVG
jgi:two-component system CheB/CheR fusion protein